MADTRRAILPASDYHSSLSKTRLAVSSTGHSNPNHRTAVQIRLDPQSGRAACCWLVVRVDSLAAERGGFSLMCVLQRGDCVNSSISI